MRQISVEDADFVRLQSLAVPFEDTPATVIAKLLDSYGAAPVAAPSSTSTVRQYTPGSIPPLTHTKVMGGSFGGIRPSRPTWDAFVVLALTKAHQKTGSIDDLRRIAGANVTQGKKTIDGYKYLQGQDFSYQGVSSEDAVKIVIRCARALQEGLEIEFVWRDKDGAHHRGERGVIRYSAD